MRAHARGHNMVVAVTGSEGDIIRGWLSDGRYCMPTQPAGCTIQQAARRAQARCAPACRRHIHRHHAGSRLAVGMPITWHGVHSFTCSGSACGARARACARRAAVRSWFGISGIPRAMRRARIVNNARNQVIPPPHTGCRRRIIRHTQRNGGAAGCHCLGWLAVLHAACPRRSLIVN